MKTLILLEGIASSGKTTVERLLAEALPNSKIVTEGETLMSLIDNRDHKTAVEHLKKVIEAVRNESFDYLIIDRFHLTHAFRTNVSLKEFSSVEDSLRELGDALIVLLVIDPLTIQTRIQETMELRKENWKKRSAGKFGGKNEVLPRTAGAHGAARTRDFSPIFGDRYNQEELGGLRRSNQRHALIPSISPCHVVRERRGLPTKSRVSTRLL